ncbi:hypothetical protein [Phenylobacterium sp.]|uniref:terminase small subunit-like protein n=1 Tax=Phenylobacterium sp. TaxID=1871053 RepID=UPI0025F11C07|nr:hypothetical protein [Phenylobacterium sp.]
MKAAGAVGRPGRAAPGVSVYSEAVGREICAAVAAGRSLMEVCAEPGRPHRTTVRGWERAHPEFGMAMREAYAQARLGARMRDRQARAEFEARKLAVRGGAGPGTGAARRRGGKASSYTRALGALICARLAQGESLTSITRDEAMPCYGTVYGWLKRHPAFEAMYVEAREAQAEYLFDEARDVALAASPATVALARLQFDVIRWQAARLSPKKYLERLVVVDAVAGARIAAAEAEARARQAEPPVSYSITHFEVMDGRVLAAPPRNEREAQAWVEATGAPYAEGIGPKGQIRPPPLF